MTFYLGTHERHWLYSPAFVGVPLFVSAHRLRRRPPRGSRRWRRATTRWACDSGGFTRLYEFGHWDIPAADYAAEVRAWAVNIGSLDWAAPQDWMCEDIVVASVALREGLLAANEEAVETMRGEFRSRRRREAAEREVWVMRAASCLPLDPAFHRERTVVHQTRTIDSILTLRAIAPDLAWVPVLQGQAIEEYAAHADMYAAAGIDLAAEGTVGVGSVCRRQDTTEAEELMRLLAGMGIPAHGFGFKLGGLERCWQYLRSADSLAWSYQAVRRAPLPGCRHQHCNNCPVYAKRWRADLLGRTAR